MRKWLGQVDLKGVLTTVLASVILAVGGFIWKQMEKVNTLESRIIRIENSQEQILDLLKAKKK